MSAQGWPYNASELLRRLVAMPAAEVDARRRAVLRAAPLLLYPEGDARGGAVDALVQGLLGGRPIRAPWQPPVTGVVRNWSTGVVRHRSSASPSRTRVRTEISKL